MEITNGPTSGNHPSRTSARHPDLEKPSTWFPHFLSPAWKLQQAAYYNNCRNPSLATTWAANLLHLIFKNACQQWDQRNKVLHQLQPDQVKDLALNIKIRLQYNCGHASLPTASWTLLNKPLPLTLSQPHHKKHQWLISIKAACQCQHTTTARIATAQQCLMEQLFRIANQPTQNHWPPGDQVIPPQE